MDEIKTISWRELTGNKFNSALHPAMLCKSGYRTVKQIRRTGESIPDVFTIEYDRDYVLEFLSRKVCKPLSNFGKQSAMEVLEEALVLYEKNSLNPHFVNYPID